VTAAELEAIRARHHRHDGEQKWSGAHEDAHADRGALLAALDECRRFIEQDCGVLWDEEASYLRGEGPDPLHKECRAEVARLRKHLATFGWDDTLIEALGDK